MKQVVLVLFDTEYPEHLIDYVDVGDPKSPKGVAREFVERLENTYSLVVRCYTDTLLNLVGELIELGALTRYDCTVVTHKGKATYCEEGILFDNWPFGCFNYTGYEDEGNDY